MLCYHGTTVGGIRELIPFKMPYSNYSEPCVYLTTIESLASLYIWSKPYKWLTYGFDESGIPVYTESFKDSLEFFYGNLSGCIYECEGEFEYVESVGIKAAVISRQPVTISGTIEVYDAYERILGYERAGSMIIRRFGGLTDREHESNSKMVLGAIRRLELLKGGHPLSEFVPGKFPELWRQAAEE